jgi:protoheme IX farnesyltransferase
MKAAAPVIPAVVAEDKSRFGDFLELTKPRLNFLVLVTTLAGFYLGSQGGFDVLRLIHTLLGTALVAASASVLNQYLEREADGRMHRTQDRPLPAGRLQPYEAFWFGLVTGLVGTAYLAVAVNLLAGLLAGLTWYSYLCIYTPLKTQSWLNTAVGAVPGAIPPMIGWAAARGQLSPEAFVLFGVLFLWQFPHFYAIAWRHRDDYARGRFKMLSLHDVSGARTARQIAGFSAALWIVSLLPTLLGLTGKVYLFGALVLGGAFLALGLMCLVNGVEKHARRVFLASVIYLPLLLALMTLDKA